MGGKEKTAGEGVLFSLSVNIWDSPPLGPGTVQNGAVVIWGHVLVTCPQITG